MSNIIFLNGTSSSGKTTLAKEIQTLAETPFWQICSDQFVEAGMLPRRENDGGLFDWTLNRPKFFKAFHNCVKVVLDSGNDVILDHIIESTDWFDDLKIRLAEHDVFFVGVHCPIDKLREREARREDKDVGNRYLGEAAYHLKHVHTYAHYDFELDSSEQSVREGASMILSAWARREESKFFA